MSVFAVVLLGAIVNSSLPIVHANPNTERAGVLRNGVLTVTLEAKAASGISMGAIARR
jgi:hypothetical protein